jgi:glycosyltransferase involved in cell wall biosynthesis
VNVTVAICTWNRAALLDQTLTGMRDLRVPAGLTWELVVVNNNSTDNTDAVLARHADTLPLRRLFEPRQGHSNARNCAIKHARGNLLVWTDDDVLVDPSWLAEYARAADQFPDAGFFGGPVDPWFVHPPPASIREHLAEIPGAFALRDLGPDTRPFGPDEHPVGANMALRTTLLKAHQFDPRLGRVGDGMVGDDETQLFESLAARGLPGMWIGPARVRHYIPPDRANWGFVWRYFRGLGQTAVRRGAVAGCPTIRGYPRWVVRGYLERRTAAWVYRLVGSRRWVGAYTRAAYYAGILAEYPAGRAAPADNATVEKPAEVSA